MGSGPLADFPLTVEIPVAWGDMDAFGHVNNTVFFRWFETARMAFLEAIGFLEGGEGSGVGPILASTSCRFRRPVAFPDTVTAGVRVTSMGRDRFDHGYRVVSRARGEVVGEGAGTVVSYHYGAGHPTPIPDAVRAAIEGLRDRT